MITYIKGNIFQSPAQVLVNTVNTVGVMGKGIALEFKKQYPEMFEKYQALCESGEFKIGNLFLYKTSNKWILNFPTKKHWRQPSRIEYIEKGLQSFVKNYNRFNIHSVAFPALGCGNGELDFEKQVQPMMENYLKTLLIDIFIYPDKHRIILPEHKQKEEFELWLRSEPQSLAFDEVWEDLKKIIQSENKFKTLVKKTEFTIKISKEEDELIISASKKITINHDELLAIWQQLRNYGFMSRGFISGLTQEIYYLFPLFEKLPYVQLIKMSDSYETLNQSAYAMQLVPIGYPKQKETQQLSLFNEVANNN
jgi:O-acetyl-ADP-ribose deacetylase (regulator of RNase III)